MKEKSVIFDNIKYILDDDGVIYGATILGNQAKHNILGKKLIDTYNDKGIFCNLLDNADELENELKKRFSQVSLKIEGTVALFLAKGKN